MKLVRPIQMTTANVTSSVPQTEPLWSAATTYALNAVVHELINGQPYRFISKQAGNTNHQPSLDAAELWWNADGSTNRWQMFDGTIQTQTTNPESIDVTVQLAPTEKADHVFLSNVYGTEAVIKVREAVGRTLGNNPLWTQGAGSPMVVVTDPNHHFKVGDGVYISGATAVGGITPNGYVTVTDVSIPGQWFFNWTSNATGTAFGGGAAVKLNQQVYDSHRTLVSNGGIQDWYAYFNEPTVRLKGMIASDLPGMYPGATIDISIKAPGDTAKVGLAIVGQGRNLGGTRWAAELGFRDLSVKAENEFGGLYVVERAFKRTASFDVVVAAGFVDQLQIILEEYRAIPVLFIGNDRYQTMHIYGFVKSFKTVVAFPDVSFCALDLESLA